MVGAIEGGLELILARAAFQHGILDAADLKVVIAIVALQRGIRQVVGMERVMAGTAGQVRHALLGIAAGG
ncbi:hypothetical protein D3C78_1090790 [compost metagenome]